MSENAPAASDRAARRERLVRAAEDIRLAVRRQDGQETPLGPRALRTRTRLLETAARMFSEKGYLATSLNDIAKEAGVSLPTLYQYFADRHDLVATLAADHALGMLERGADDWDPTAGRLGLRRAIAALVTLYAESTEFFSFWEVASRVDDRLAQLRRDFEDQFHEGFARRIRRGVQLDLIRRDVEPLAAARALNMMVSTYCHDAFIVTSRRGEQPEPVDDVVDLLTSLWANAIGLREGDWQAG